MIAATFCWKIRYALTPVFGTDFPAMCTEPDDPAFLRFGIDGDIILRCTQMANADRERSQQVSSSENIRCSHSGTMKSLRPKSAQTLDTESGYCTDTDRSLRESPPTDFVKWTPVNIPNPVHIDHCNIPAPAIAASKAPRVSPMETSPMREIHSNKRTRSFKNEANIEPIPESASYSMVEAGPSKRRKFLTMKQEARAAYMLMHLHIADAALEEGSRFAARRASH